MSSAALIGVLGAFVGAGASTFTAWLTQRGQLRREVEQRRYDERTRWTNDKRDIFREIHVASNDWAHLLRKVARHRAVRGAPSADGNDLRQVERCFHGILYDAARLCGQNVCDGVDLLEDELLRLTMLLGVATEYGLPGPDEAADEAAALALAEDFPALREVRIRLMAAMRDELGSDRYAT